jgi:hypothetical protein
LDLTSEPLSTINQRLTNSLTATTTTRSASFNLVSKNNQKLGLPSTTQPFQPPLSTEFNTRHPQPIIGDGRSRHNGPLIATTNQIYISSRNEHHSQTNSNTERDRTFIHHSDSRPFKLGTAVQMKPIDDLLSSSSSSSGRRRPCHRQNALRYKSIEQEPQNERQSRSSTPVTSNYQNRIYSSETSSTNIPRYQSIERRIPSSSPQLIKSFPFDMNNELRPCDISWSVREKAKLFEHKNQTKLSTGRENYV